MWCWGHSAFIRLCTSFCIYVPSLGSLFPRLSCTFPFLRQVRDLLSFARESSNLVSTWSIGRRTGDKVGQMGWTDRASGEEGLASIPLQSREAPSATAKVLRPLVSLQHTLLVSIVWGPEAGMELVHRVTVMSKRQTPLLQGDSVYNVPYSFSWEKLGTSPCSLPWSPL